MSLPDPEVLQSALLKQGSNGVEKKDDSSDEELPPIKKIHLNVTGSRGKRYEGDFVYKVPTLGDQILIGNMKTTYLPNGSLGDANAALLAEQICYLQVTLQEKPSWWKPMQFYDATPISALYSEAIEYERRFHGADARNGKLQEGADSSVQDPESDDSEDQPDVGRKVQPPAKRSEVIIAHTKGSR